MRCFGLFYSNHQILAHAPEAIRVSNAQDILPLRIALERIRIGRVRGVQLCTLRIEADRLRHAIVNARKIVAVKVFRLQDIAVGQNALLAEFFLRAEDVISRIDLLILCGYGLRLLLIAAGKRVDAII